jgi:hypothetical protein
MSRTPALCPAIFQTVSLAISVDTDDLLPRVGASTRAMLKTALSACRSLWAQGAAGTSSAALEAFEGA